MLRITDLNEYTNYEFRFQKPDGLVMATYYSSNNYRVYMDKLLYEYSYSKNWRAEPS